MKTDICKFTKENVLVSVLSNGTVLLANAETKKIYKVQEVEETKMTLPDKIKIVKEVLNNGK